MLDHAPAQEEAAYCSPETCHEVFRAIMDLSCHRLKEITLIDCAFRALMMVERLSALANIDDGVDVLSRCPAIPRLLLQRVLVTQKQLLLSPPAAGTMPLPFGIDSERFMVYVEHIVQSLVRASKVGVAISRRSFSILSTGGGNALPLYRHCLCALNDRGFVIRAMLQRAVSEDIGFEPIDEATLDVLKGHRHLADAFSHVVRSCQLNSVASPLLSAALSAAKTKALMDFCSESRIRAPGIYEMVTTAGRTRYPVSLLEVIVNDGHFLRRMSDPSSRWVHVLLPKAKANIDSVENCYRDVLVRRSKSARDSSSILTFSRSAYEDRAFLDIVTNHLPPLAFSHVVVILTDIKKDSESEDPEVLVHGNEKKGDDRKRLGLDFVRALASSGSRQICSIGFDPEDYYGHVDLSVVIRNIERPGSVGGSEDARPVKDAEASEKAGAAGEAEYETPLGELTWFRDMLADYVDDRLLLTAGNRRSLPGKLAFERFVLDKLSRMRSRSVVWPMMRSPTKLTDCNDTTCSQGDHDSDVRRGNFAIVAVDSRENPWTVASVIISLSNVSDAREWEVIVFCGTQNADYMRRSLKSFLSANERTSRVRSVRVKPLPELGVRAGTPVDIDSYSALLKSSRFWRGLAHVGVCLFVQDDGMLIRPGIETVFFPRGELLYDYTGAPWIAEQPRLLQLMGGKRDMVGNGGLSLRNPRAMLKVAVEGEQTRGVYDLFHDRLQAVPEDVYFCRSPMVRVAPRELAARFSSEQMLNVGGGSMGFHKPWAYHDASSVRAFFEEAIRDDRSRS